MPWLEAVMETSRKLGPYVLVEMLLPGGTLFALLLFAHRHPVTVRKYAVEARNRVVGALSAACNAVVSRV